MTALWVLLAAIVVLMGYIRLAPSDPATWHRPPAVEENADLPGGAMRLVRPASATTLARLDALVRATPRTKVLAGSVQDGMITYVTRSRVMGFPDYTTVALDDDALRIHGRLRFGRSDLGVNAARIDGWLEALGPGGQS